MKIKELYFSDGFNAGRQTEDETLGQGLWLCGQSCCWTSGKHTRSYMPPPPDCKNPMPGYDGYSQEANTVISKFANLGCVKSQIPGLHLSPSREGAPESLSVQVSHLSQISRKIWETGKGTSGRFAVTLLELMRQPQMILCCCNIGRIFSTANTSSVYHRGRVRMPVQGTKIVQRNGRRSAKATELPQGSSRHSLSSAYGLLEDSLPLPRPQTTHLPM